MRALQSRWISSGLETKKLLKKIITNNRISNGEESFEKVDPLLFHISVLKGKFPRFGSCHLNTYH